MTLASINELYLPTQNIYPNSNWISIYSSDLVINGEPVKEGTMVYARDAQGNLCGEMRITQPGFFELMPVYMDDPRTSQIDEGAQIGDSLSIYINNYLLPVKIPVTVCGQMEDLNHYITGIDTAVSINLPQKYDLGQNYPNPFNNTTFIPYQLPVAGKVEISIYNILGQKVCDILNGFHPPGNYREIWNGRNMSGHAVASGIYFCRMKSGVFEKMRKIILIK